MGRILDRVRNHSSYSKEHEAVLRAFLHDFDVIEAVTCPTAVEGAAYVMRPLGTATEALGLERAVVLIVSQMEHQSVFGAIDRFLGTSAMASRAESLAYALAAPVPDLSERVRLHLAGNVYSRLIVPFSWHELKGARAGFVKQRFNTSLLSRDLFDVQTVIRTDTYYFGRIQFAHELLDRFRSGQNTGLFGLRRTGKTSAVLKLLRDIRTYKCGTYAYIDAQNRDIYTMRWWELLEEIARQLAKKAKIQDAPQFSTPFTAESAIEGFRRTIGDYLKKLPAGAKHILVVIDEIEHISPDICPDEARHWNADFGPFWKALRAMQTSYHDLTFLIVGVNATAVEQAALDGQDNPLFALAGIRYIPLFSEQEVSSMVGLLGKIMGIRFDKDACAYLLQRYGGHPMLIRQVCSWHHKRALEEGVERPFHVTSAMLQSYEDVCESHLFPYVRQVLGILQKWYHDEYEMLLMLAQGKLDDFNSFAEIDPSLEYHLQQYGLVGRRAGIPELRIAVIRRYLRGPREAQNGPEDSSVEWLALVTDISQLRNSLEPKLRRFVKQILRAHYGPDRWIDPLLKTLPTELQAKLGGVDRDEILSDRIFLSNLIEVIKANWDKFRALEYSHKHKLGKSQVETLLTYINTHREDAHAKAVSPAEVATLAIVCSTLNAAIDEFLVD